MFEWLLVRGSRVFDWVLVVLVVYALVFICQFLVNFFSPPSEQIKDDRKE